VLARGFEPRHCALRRAHAFRDLFLGEPGLGPGGEEFADKLVRVGVLRVGGGEALALHGADEELIVVVGDRAILTLSHHAPPSWSTAWFPLLAFTLTSVNRTGGARVLLRDAVLDSDGRRASVCTRV
jgi:hypothetical protein